jgi:hypothetical protein
MRALVYTAPGKVDLEHVYGPRQLHLSSHTQRSGWRIG